MKILQIGVGSMGRRRIRDLSKLGKVDLAVHDSNSDRLDKIREQYSLTTFESLEKALAWKPEALVISTPPNQHAPFVKIAIERGLNFFSEADIWIHQPSRLDLEIKEKKLIGAPSCSLNFLPITQKLRKLIPEIVGTKYAYQAFLSTNLHAWHPSERGKFYAYDRNTSAAREMVPFELHFLNSLFGKPQFVSGNIRQLGGLGNVGEDSFSLQMTLEDGGIGQLMVMMATPVTMRRGACIGSDGIIEWNLESGVIIGRRHDKVSAMVYECGTLDSVLEAAYNEEISSFIAAIEGGNPWPHSYLDAAACTASLAAAEKSAKCGETVKLDLNEQPLNYGGAYGFQETVS